MCDENVEVAEEVNFILSHHDYHVQFEVNCFYLASYVFSSTVGSLLFTLEIVLQSVPVSLQTHFSCRISL